MKLCSVLLLAVTIGFTGHASRAEDRNQLPAGALAILDKATEYELLALNPGQADDTKPGLKKLHGWEILGQTTIKDDDVRKKVKDVLLKGIADNQGESAKCFEPRHGLRARHDGKTVELVICFECLQIQVYLDGKEQGGTVLTTRAPQATLNEILKKANIAVAR